jgi:HK97 family phage portal protein
MTTKTTKKTTAKPKQNAKALSKTKPAEPYSDGLRIMYLPRVAGVRVNEDNALTLGAVWACVRVISESLAGLPWQVYRNRFDGGIELQTEHALNWILDTQPNPETSAFIFRETLIAHCLTWGNGYAEIERDAVGRPVWLWQITPDRVQPERFQGRIIYDIANPRGPNTVLERDDMFHVAGLGFDGLVGYSVIRHAARTIGMGIAVDEAGAGLFANDSTPGGLLKHPGKLSEAARANVLRSWQERHGGPANRRRVAILEEGLEWQQTGLPPEDAQLVEQRQLTPTEIARWFRVPPHKIGDLTRATFSNIEHQAIEFVNDTLRPWAERFESEADLKLFGRNNRGNFVTVINLDELKRGDLQSQASFVKDMTGVGVFSVNDGLRFLGRNPIGPDGDKRFVPLNMQLLEKAGEEPESPETPPSDAPDVPPIEPPPVEVDRLDRLRAKAMPLLVAECKRVLRREEHEARSRLKQGKLTDEWAGEFLAKHRGYAREKLLLPLQLFAECHGGTDEAAEIAVEMFVKKHLATFADFASDPQERDPMTYAAELLKYVQAAAATQGAA